MHCDEGWLYFFLLFLFFPFLLWGAIGGLIERLVMIPLKLERNAFEIRWIYSLQTIFFGQLYMHAHSL